jgi:hypothetical protein
LRIGNAYPVLKGALMMMAINRHWWNGRTENRGRRDVFIRTDGQQWEVEARTDGRSAIHQCPGAASASILADTWLGSRQDWRKVV